MVPVGDRVHVPELEKLPPLVSEPKLTLPVGVEGVPTLASVTVAVQVVDWPTATGDGEQPTPVEVMRLVTVMDVMPLLVACAPSPP